MIVQFRHHLEAWIGLPVHYVAINASELMPAITVAKSLSNPRREMVAGPRPKSKPATRHKLTGIDLTIYAYDYERLDAIATEIEEKYTGQRIAIAQGGDPMTFSLDDEDDDSYPSADGSDDWIYARQMIFRVHHK